MSGNANRDSAPVDDNHSAALRALVREARELAPPVLDWNGVEASLLTRIKHERITAQAPKPANHWATLSGFAAAAAALVMLMAQTSQQHLVDPYEPKIHSVEISALTPMRAHPDELPTYDASEIGADARISSGDEPLRIQVKGVATWVLAPNSQARIVSTSAPYVVALERGALHAEVVERKTNNAVLETFAVEVGGTRVAVHGTLFSVIHHGDEVAVEVTRGAVTIGPGGGRGITTGHLLVGPAHAAFSLDGAKQARMLPLHDTAPLLVADNTPLASGQPLAVPHGVEAHGAAPRLGGGNTAAPETAGGDVNASHQRTGPMAKNTSQAAITATAADGVSTLGNDAPATSSKGASEASAAALTAAQAQAMVVGCLSRAMNGGVGPNTVLLISSQVSAHTDAAGNVLSVRFHPPLKPALQQRCASTLFGRTLVGGPDVHFSVNLARR